MIQTLCPMNGETEKIPRTHPNRLPLDFFAHKPKDFFFFEQKGF